MTRRTRTSGLDERDLRFLRDCEWACRILQKIMEIDEFARGQSQIIQLLRRRATVVSELRVAYEDLLGRDLIRETPGRVVVTANGREIVHRAC